MNPEKARELFSDYREGDLNPNLHASLEAGLKSDASLMEEYRQFDEVLRQFESGLHAPVEVPFDLHDRIMARVDKSMFDERRRSKSGLFSGWRLAVTGGLAAVALVAAVLSFNSGGGTSISGTSLSKVEPGVTLSNKGTKVVVFHVPSQSSVLVKDNESGELISRFDLLGKKLESEQGNLRPHAVLLRIESVSENGTSTTLVAIPGMNVNSELKGRGNAQDFSKAVADTYQEPVRIVSKNLEAEFSWSLEPGDATGRYGDPKSGDVQFGIERRGGMLCLTD